MMMCPLPCTCVDLPGLQSCDAGEQQNLHPESLSSPADDRYYYLVALYEHGLRQIPPHGNHASHCIDADGRAQAA